MEYLYYPVAVSIIVLLGIVLWWYSIYFWYLYRLKGFLVWGKHLPLLGTALDYRDPTDAYEKFLNFFTHVGDKAFAMVGPLPTVITADPNLAKLVLTSKSAKKSFLYSLAHTFLGDGIITSDGDRAKVQRKLLNPGFQYDVLTRNVSLFSLHADRMMDVFEKEIRKDSSDIFKYTTEYALSIIYETSMGTTFDTIKDMMPSYVESCIKNLSILYERFCNPFYHFDFIYRFSKNYRIEQKVRQNVIELIDTIINERRLAKQNVANMDSTLADDRTILLDMLLQYRYDGCFYTEKSLKDEIHTVVIAATDTTSTVLAYAIHLLAEHTTIQEKVFMELQPIFQDKSDESITMIDLSNMVYLQAVIQETLRLYPAAPYLSRELSEDIEFDGMTLPKGLIVNLVVYGLHRNAKYYQDPHKFLPERFLSKEKMHPYSYIPFGGGSRNCIGNKYAMLAIKTFLSKLLMKYELVSVKHPIVLKPEVLMVSKHGFRVQIRPRKFIAGTFDLIA